MQMRINWKLRFQNPITLISAVTLALDIIYNILAMAGVTPPIGQNEVMEVVERIVEFLAIVGIITDPTTQGLNDSDKAMQYVMPNKPELPDDFFEDAEGGDEDGE